VRFKRAEREARDPAHADNSVTGSAVLLWCSVTTSGTRGAAGPVLRDPAVDPLPPVSHCTWASWVAVRGTASCGTRHQRARMSWSIGKFRQTFPTLTRLSAMAVPRRRRAPLPITTSARVRSCVPDQWRAHLSHPAAVPQRRRQCQPGRVAGRPPRDPALLARRAAGVFTSEGLPGVPRAARGVQSSWSGACRTAKAAASVRRCMPSLANREDT